MAESIAKLKGRGGPGRGQGRKPKPPGERYEQYPLKLPPWIIDWLAANTDNHNGFIVEATEQAIARRDRGKVETENEIVST